MAKPTLYKDNSKSQNFLETLQSVILNRFFKPYGGDEPIIYEFTQDRALIHQYHVPLETMYRRMYDAHDFKADVDVYDKLSHILIARRGRLCLGGCRLIDREYDEMWRLPLETEDFRLRDLFPELPLKQVRHGEISRFAVMEDTGCDENIFYGLCKVMYEKVIASRVHYLFAKSTYPLSRNWRLIANSLGAKTTRICENLEVPEPSFIRDEKWYITLSDLSNLYPSSENVEPARHEDAAESVRGMSPEKPRLVLVD